MSQSVSVTQSATAFSRADVHAARADEGLTEHSVDGHAKIRPDPRERTGRIFATARKNY